VEFFESRYLCTVRGGRGKEDEAGTRTLDEAHAVECDASRDPPRSRIIAGSDAQVVLTHSPSLFRAMHLHWEGNRFSWQSGKSTKTRACLLPAALLGLAGSIYTLRRLALVNVRRVIERGRCSLRKRSLARNVPVLKCSQARDTSTPYAINPAISLGAGKDLGQEGTWDC